jgi:DNA-binding transcriptional LysR family regulator
MLNNAQLARADLNLLVLLETVMEERHVGRAAARLNLTPSAVSHGLGRLRRLLNDPLFLKTPKGVVPTERAVGLAPAVAEILAGVRNVMASARPFDPTTSRRRFVIGAMDGISTVILPPLVAKIRRAAPGIDVSFRQQRFHVSLAELEARAVDIALIPLDDIAPRFAARVLYAEDFVIAARLGHPFLGQPTLSSYCEMRHAVVSLGDDSQTLVDTALQKKHLTRRVVLWVPSFMQALAVLAETDLVAALPRRIVEMQAKRFGLAYVEAPLLLPRSTIRAVVPKPALTDQGIAWLLDRLEEATRAGNGEPHRIKRRRCAR